MGDGTQIRHYTYGGDLARGIVTAMEAPQARNEDFNLSTATSTTVLELAEVIWRKIKGPDEPLRWVSDDPFDHDVQRRVPATTKAAKVLGFEATTTLDEMLDEVIPWIATALEQAGYSGWERLIVSGQDKVAKHDGTAFRMLRAEFPDARILHIGDHPVSDVEMPRRAGVEAVHLPAGAASVPASSALPTGALSRIVANRRHTHLEFGWSLIGGLTARAIDRTAHDPASDIGYAVLGPLLVRLMTVYPPPEGVAEEEL